MSTGTAALMEACSRSVWSVSSSGTATGARNIGIAGAIAVGSYIGLVSVWEPRAALHESNAFPGASS